ncbi:MAG: hypothetical protein HYW07_02015 [Candidatus Latescibacteria bacterium]|nr:hypothetical protein [Candidatus Latescibacterota bacterium]
MAYLITMVDPEGVPVFLGETEWQAHILKHHPEMAAFRSDIERIVLVPDTRHRDPDNERVYLHYGQIEEPRRLHPKLAYLLVVIKYVNAPERGFQRTGFVSSAYFLKDLKRRGVPL